MPPDLIGTGEIEQAHQISRVQVWRLLRAGDWPEPYATFTGGRKVWRREDIAAHIETLLASGRLRRFDNGGLMIVPKRYATAGA